MLWTITEVMNMSARCTNLLLPIIQVKIDENPEVKHNKVGILYLCFCLFLFGHIWWWYTMFSSRNYSHPLMKGLIDYSGMPCPGHVS